MNETKYPWLNYKTLYGIIAVLLVILIAGSVAWYSQQKQIAQDLNQAVPNTSTHTQSQSELAGWKTYTNAKYGFEVKYPLTWKVLESYDDSYNSDTISFQSENKSGLNIFVNQNSKNVSLAQYLKQADKDSQTAYEGYPSKIVLSSQQVTVGGLPAVKRVEDLQAAGFTTIQTYLINGSKVYTFRLMPSESSVPKYSLDEEKVYNQILSTFKFTSSTDATANWKTYTNTQYGFSFKYPNEWTVGDTSQGASYAVFEYSVYPNYDYNQHYGAGPLLQIGLMNISLSEYIANSNFSNKSTYTLDGKSGYLIKFLEKAGIYTPIYAFEKDGKAFVINVNITDGTGIGQSDVDQILSTFKFTK